MAISAVRRIEADAEAGMRSGIRARMAAEVARQERERLGAAAALPCARGLAA